MSTPTPYQDLYHVMGHTYGTWLPGDPKGFRTRHHREHCEGDYRNPPPRGTFDELLERSKRLMKREPVYLEVPQRRVAVDAFVESLVKRGIVVRIGAIDRIHFHILAAFPDHNPRHWIGVAKKESSHALNVAGMGVEGGICAVRCKCLPISGAAHAERAFGYIQDHEAKGAAIVIPCAT